MNSYSPYSNTEETCYIEGKSGVLYPGVRIENISFPLSISAIQAAVCSCLGNGDQPVQLFQSEPFSELKNQWVSEFDLQVSEMITEPDNQFSPLLPADTDIPETLKNLSKTSITIHSKFPVSALLETDSGFIPGVNVEVEAWVLGLCAERVALSRAISSGITDFRSIHIYAPKGDFSSPCGACRQVLAEFMPRKVAELHHGDGTLSKHNISQLMPYGFTSGSLKKGS